MSLISLIPIYINIAINNNNLPIMNQEKVDGGGGGGNNNNNNKLRDGPCAKQYLDLEACAVEKKENVKSHRVS